MTEANPSAQATPELDSLLSPPPFDSSCSEPTLADLCIYCQDLVFNERDHFDTFEDHGYRLLLDEDGDLHLEVAQDRYLGFAGSHSHIFPDGVIRLRTQLIRKDNFPSLPSITATAEAGCHFCKCLLSSRLADKCTFMTTDEPYDTKSGEVTVTIKFFYLWGWRSFGIRELVAAATTNKGSSAEELFLVEADFDQRCAEVLDIRTDTFLPNWRFDDKAAVMNYWISTCKSSCHPERADTTLPTRLLDLSSSQGPDQDIRVIYSKDIPTPIGCKYAALSHCWGPPDLPHLKAEMGSLEKMLCNIPFQSLPSNYRDAVRVTRALGIDYLWIDALCIVQDSLEDWEAESLRMVDVYQQAHVTLIVATGNCCHDGFLDPKVSQMVRMPYVTSLDDSSMEDTYYLRKSYDTEEDIRHSPWNQRGWTLQESAFSTRRLYFTQNAISFSCDSKLHLMHGESCSAKMLLTTESSMKNANEWWGYYAEWSNLTEQYSRRHLTCQQDRLPAISAWAHLISQKVNDRYLAGLWEHDILHGLLWSCRTVPSTHTLGDRLKLSLKEDFVAPSWSWASQTQGIRYGWWPVDESDRDQILKIEVQPIGLNSFGRLRSGHMIVSGVVCPLAMAPILKAMDCFESRTDDGCQIQYYADWWEERMDVTPGQQVEPGIFREVKTLLLASCTSRPMVGMAICTCGLLLLSTGVDEEYWRVGMFRINHDSGREFEFNSGRRTIRIV